MSKGVQITYGNVVLPITPSDIRRDIGNNRIISTNVSPKLGNMYHRTKVDSKQIVVDFFIWSKNINELKHEIASYLTPSEPKMLQFDDEPDKYYLAIVEGDVSMSEGTGYYSFGSVTFTIPDGIAHSTTSRLFTDFKRVGNKYTATVVNNGNVNAKPVIRIKHNSENGWLAVVNETGVFETGNREEQDGKIVEKSELLMDYRDNKIVNALDLSTKNQGVVNDKKYPNATFNGELAIDNTWGRPHIFLTRKASTTVETLATASWDIPIDRSGQSGSLYDYLWWRQIFWVGSPTQQGFMKIMVSDEDGNFLYGIETFKRKYGLESEYNLLVSNGNGGWRFQKQWRFKATHLNNHNPFNHNRGWADLTRSDDKIKMSWFGSYFDYNVPEIRGKKSAKIHLLIGAFPNKDMVTHCYFDGFLFKKNKVKFEEDIPNRYQIGSEIVIDSGRKTLKVNNEFDLSDRIFGSTFIEVPPGESEIEIYTSEWCESPPSLSIGIDEGYL